MIRKAPPAIILTTEFDMFKRGSENAGKIYKKNGKLLEYGCMKGSMHGHFFMFGNKRTAAWFRVTKDMLDVYLKQ